MILSVVTFRNLSLRSAEFHFRSLSRPKGSPLPQIGHRFRNLKSKITKNFGARGRAVGARAQKLGVLARLGGRNLSLNRGFSVGIVALSCHSARITPASMQFRRQYHASPLTRRGEADVRALA